MQGGTNPPCTASPSQSSTGHRPLSAGAVRRTRGTSSAHHLRRTAVDATPSAGAPLAAHQDHYRQTAAATGLSTMGGMTSTRGTTDGDRLDVRSMGLITVLCAAQVLEVLGVTVVIVALPVIGADLDMPDSELQLVVSLYTVLYGSLLLFAGRVSDLVDRRTVFGIGLALGLVGAAACATAPTAEVLLLGRAVQGVGGAVVTPAALSLLTNQLPDRPRA